MPLRFDPELREGTYLRRYKRFLVDVSFQDGSTHTSHCTNTGSLLGCLREGAPSLHSPADNPNRKLKWTWRAIKVGRTWVGVDTSLAVPIVEEAIHRGVIPELQGFHRSTREVKYGKDMGSRIDILLSSGGTPTHPTKPRSPWQNDERVYVEVKNTTLKLGTRTAAFPDAVTTRGQKHLEELMHVVDEGHRGAIVFCAQRNDVSEFTAADHIDPRYGELLRQALAHGVEAHAIAARFTKHGVEQIRQLPIQLP